MVKRPVDCKLDLDANVFLKLWQAFKEDNRITHPDPQESSHELCGPTETLELLLSENDESFTPRAQFILGRVRDWLRGAEVSAIDDRQEVENLFERCMRQQPELAQWQTLSSAERERVFEQLLRVVGGLSSTIRQERPRLKDVEFCIEWQTDGDGLGFWAASSPTRKFSLIDSVRYLAKTMGLFASAPTRAVTVQVLYDLRSGDLTLPLLERVERSTPEYTWLAYLPPENSDGKGLILPEFESSLEPEIVLRRQVPQVARVYEESLIIAAQQDLDWNTLAACAPDASVAKEDEQEAGQLASLCKEIHYDTALSLQAVCGFLEAPLSMICQTATKQTLKRRAGSSLAKLRMLKSH